MAGPEFFNGVAHVDEWGSVSLTVGNEVRPFDADPEPDLMWQLFIILWFVLDRPQSHFGCMREIVD